MKLATVMLAAGVALTLTGCPATQRHRNENATVKSMALDETIIELRKALERAAEGDKASPMMVYPASITVQLLLTETAAGETGGKIAVAFPPLSPSFEASTSQQLVQGNTVTIVFRSIYDVPQNAVGWNIWGKRPVCSPAIRTKEAAERANCLINNVQYQPHIMDTR